MKFAAIYRFTAVPGQEAAFEEAWAKLTEYIHQYEGGLGSRLHKDPSGSYIAYAQWPTRDVWEGAGGNLPEEANQWRSQMRETSSNIETIHELDVVDDLLKSKPFEGSGQP